MDEIMAILNFVRWPVSVLNTQKVLFLSLIIIDCFTNINFSYIFILTFDCIDNPLHLYLTSIHVLKFNLLLRKFNLGCKTTQVKMLRWAIWRYFFSHGVFILFLFVYKNHQIFDNICLSFQLSRAWKVYWKVHVTTVLKVSDEGFCESDFYSEIVCCYE